ncbi:hypothetical protein MCOR02_001167 [Pyricularia oryzae]|nr:hypothetical protein MCOR02_001167 [Pyricularia oryzae]KAI6323214.1 hypothetical protein MCOR34_001961 [Pyricularia oryzae]KAI6447051.1 hypothetical protein MCOR17_010634 [Pyricularia oryzae]KAI6479726.1 hypothetical protein MCOR13_011358 [Pyricularia oryzae]
MPRGLGHTVSFLLETRGIRLADQHLQRRVATQLVKTEAILDMVILGLEVERLGYVFSQTVEVLNATSSSLARTLYEGHVLNTVTTGTYQREVVLPVGSFKVNTRGRRTRRRRLSRSSPRLSTAT